MFYLFILVKPFCLAFVNQHSQKLYMIWLQPKLIVFNYTILYYVQVQYMLL